MSKNIDCIKMKEGIYTKIYSETKQMNLTEYVDYITQSVKESNLWQRFENNIEENKDTNSEKS